MDQCQNPGLCLLLKDLNEVGNCTENSLVLFVVVI